MVDDETQGQPTPINPRLELLGGVLSEFVDPAWVEVELRRALQEFHVESHDFDEVQLAYLQESIVFAVRPLLEKEQRKKLEQRLTELWTD